MDCIDLVSPVKRMISFCVWLVELRMCDRGGSGWDKGLGLCRAHSMDRGMSCSGLLGWLGLLALLDFRIHQAIFSYLSARRHLRP